MVINNSLLLCWCYGDLLTQHTKTVTLPMSYKKQYVVIGVAFWVDSIARHTVSSKTLSSFTVTSSVRSCSTDTYLTIGH